MKKSKVDLLIARIEELENRLGSAPTPRVQEIIEKAVKSVTEDKLKKVDRIADALNNNTKVGELYTKALIKIICFDSNTIKNIKLRKEFNETEIKTLFATEKFNFVRDNTISAELSLSSDIKIYGDYAPITNSLVAENYNIDTIELNNATIKLTPVHETNEDVTIKRKEPTVADVFKAPYKFDPTTIIAVANFIAETLERDKEFSKYV